MTYSIKGRQYVAIVGGNGSGAGFFLRRLTPDAYTANRGNSVYVFALPQD